MFLKRIIIYFYISQIELLTFLALFSLEHIFHLANQHLEQSLKLLIYIYFIIVCLIDSSNLKLYLRYNFFIISNRISCHLFHIFYIIFSQFSTFFHILVFHIFLHFLLTSPATLRYNLHK